MDENPVGKTKSQGWEIGVTRTLPITPSQGWKRIMESIGLSGADGPDAPEYQKGVAFETENGTRVEIRSYTHGSLLRMKWQPQGWETNSTLQIRVAPAKTGTRISVHHEWLEDAAQREAMRQHWTAILESF